MSIYLLPPPARRFSAEAVAGDAEGQRRWRDGSLEEDLPMRSLSEMFNVNYFLVSQTNPHIVPALNLKKRVNRKLGNLLEAEWKHRCACLGCALIWPYLFRLPAWSGVTVAVIMGCLDIYLPGDFDMCHAGGRVEAPVRARCLFWQRRLFWLLAQTHALLQQWGMRCLDHAPVPGCAV
jgi:hypothetical protein